MLLRAIALAALALLLCGAGCESKRERTDCRRICKPRDGLSEVVRVDLTPAVECWCENGEAFRLEPIPADDPVRPSLGDLLESEESEESEEVEG